MAIEAKNLNKKDELIGKFYTIRAGLSVIAGESKKIRDAESNLELLRWQDEYNDKSMQKQYNQDCEKYIKNVKILGDNILTLEANVRKKEEELEKAEQEREVVENKSPKKFYNGEHSAAFKFFSTIISIAIFGVISWIAFPSIASNNRVSFFFIICLIGFFMMIVFIYGIFTKRIGAKNKIPALESANNAASYAKSSLSEAKEALMEAQQAYEDYISLEPQRTDYEFYKYHNDVIEAERKLKDEIIPSASATAKAAKEALDKYTEGLLLEDDWKNVDLLIFYLKTGRADTLQDALLLVDKQQRTNQITEAISSAAKYIDTSLGKVSAKIDSLSANMSNELKKLGERYERSNQVLQATIAGASSLMHSQINDMSNSISSQNQALLNAQNLNNALLERANTQSDELMNELRYNQKYWVK